MENRKKYAKNLLYGKEGKTLYLIENKFSRFLFYFCDKMLDL